MANRLGLQSKLETLMGSRNVYFQPPESLKLQYPCIVYEIDYYDTKFADNRIFNKTRRYSIMLITKDADDARIDSILETFNKIRFEKQYKSDNLYHNVYSLYF